jgi:hypothetical protein
LALSVCLVLAAAQPAQAIYPQGKAFGAFWAFNLFGDGSLPLTVADCIEFTGVRVCSAFLGTCGPMEVTQDPDNASLSHWTATLQDGSGGRMQIMGNAERLGPFGSQSFVVYHKNSFGTPGFNINATGTGPEWGGCAFLRSDDFDRKALGIPTVDEVSRQIEELLGSSDR